MFCGIDLSNLLIVIEDREIHYDHIGTLDQGGINDGSNNQLICNVCNLSQGTVSDTSNILELA